MVPLNLYKIVFTPSNLNKLVSQSKHGFAFILAVGPEMAKQKWITNSVENYLREYPTGDPNILRARWEDRWELTERIDGPFKNGFVICNTANSGHKGK